LTITRLVLPAKSEKLAIPNPGLEKVVQFCLTFPSGEDKGEREETGEGEETGEREDTEDKEV
jgi:hypothetical protein